MSRIRNLAAKPYIGETKSAILITFQAIQKKGKLHYCTPRPDKVIELLAKIHGIEIGRRWFFQCMHDLEKAGFMRRQRRWLKLPDQMFRASSSLWWFTIEGAKYMTIKTILGAKEILRQMLDWIYRNDTRKPTVPDLMGNEPITDREEALKRIKELLHDIGKRPAGGITPATT